MLGDKSLGFGVLSEIVQHLSACGQRLEEVMCVRRLQAMELRGEQIYFAEHVRSEISLAGTPS
ncbi:MAG: hypothetical protein IPJ98_17885 [Bryobacterales bacterium]|nr:hypothetical protein [Bryobacterales bacterium]